MPIILSPNIYGRDFQWNIREHNKINSVIYTPLVGDISEESSIIHTESFSQVKVANTDNDITLPVADTVAATYYRYMYNKWRPLFTETEFAKARVECVMASGSRRVTLSEAAPATPDVSVQLVGTSSVIDRGGSTYEAFPSLQDISIQNFSLSQWIKSAKTSTLNNLTGDYSGSTFALNPWVRNFVPLFSPDGLKVTPNDIITTWSYDKTGILRPHFGIVDAWADKLQEGLSNEDEVLMAPINPIYLDVPDITPDNAIKLRNVQIPITCTIKKIDDYTFDISWVAPVRVSYLAASRVKPLVGNFTDIDNFAYVDEVSQVNIVFTGRKFNTETYEEVFTRVATTDNPLKIDTTPFLTSRTYYGYKDVRWTSTIAADLLDKYAEGKFLVKCSVPATWALRQGITSGTLLHVQLQDGSYIARKGVKCTFRVCNVEVRYYKHSFSVFLTLAEE